MTKSDSAYAMRAEANAVAALAPWMRNDKAAQRVADDAAKQTVLTLITADNAQSRIVETLKILAPWMSRQGASEAMGQLVKEMEKPTQKYPSWDKLAEAVEVLAPRMQPGGPSDLGHELLQAMKADVSNTALVSMARAVAAVAPYMTLKDASDAADLAMKDLTNSNDAVYSAALVTMLEALAPLLPLEKATTLADDAVKAMAKMDGYLERRDLARAAAILAARMPLEEAQKTVTKAAGFLRAKTDDPDELVALSGALAALAPRMNRLDAAKLASDIASMAAQALTNVHSADDGEKLVRAVTSLASWVPPEKAESIAEQTLKVMATPMAIGCVDDYAEATAALARQMSREDAALPLKKAAKQIVKKAADQIVNATAKTDDAYNLWQVAKAVKTLAPQMSPEDAAETAGVALQKVFLVMAKTDNPGYLDILSGAAAELEAWVSPTDYLDAITQVSQAMAKPNQPEQLRILTKILGDVVVYARPKEVAHRSTMLTQAVGYSAAPSFLVAGLAPLAEASRPLSGRFTEQQLVNLLKMPTCWQEARQVIVTQLGNQCGQTFTDEWAFVAWAHDHCPDLASPPIRPEAP